MNEKTMKDKLTELSATDSEQVELEQDVLEASEDAKDDIKSRLAAANATLTGMQTAGLNADADVPQRIVPEVNEPIILPKPEGDAITFYSMDVNQPFATALPSGVMVHSPYTTSDKSEIKYLNEFVANANMPAVTSTEETFLAA